MTYSSSKVTLSVVSHRQLDLVTSLLGDLEKLSAGQIKVLLTLNIDESLSIELSNYSFPIDLITNLKPKGFGANHNQAFKNCDTPYFCVLNPDIRLLESPFPALIADLNKHSAALIAPKVINPEGKLEDSVRKFPTPWSIINKSLLRKIYPDYSTDNLIVNPDWVGGMFMLFRSDTFKQIGGFDESYFLYYEDVDICRTFHQNHETIVYSPSTSVVHAARRTSHKNLRYLKWHLNSMLRFFIKWQLR